LFAGFRRRLLSLFPLGNTCAALLGRRGLYIVSLVVNDDGGQNAFFDFPRSALCMDAGISTIRFGVVVLFAVDVHGTVVVMHNQTREERDRNKTSAVVRLPGGNGEEGWMEDF
jgi:hypothetical protein